MTESESLKIVIRVASPADAAGEVAAKDVLGQLLAELQSLEAFDPGGDGDVQFILDDIRMNSPVTATIHPRARNQSDADLRAREAIKSVAHVIDRSRRTGKIPLGTTARQKTALRSLVDRRRVQTFDTELSFNSNQRPEKVILPAAGKIALRDALEAEQNDLGLSSIPKHREFGCLDGKLVAVGHYHHRSAFDLDTGSYGIVRCIVPEALIVRLGGAVRLRDVWTNVRVFVTGDMIFKDGGVIDRLIVSGIDSVPDASDIDDVVDPLFTRGVPSDTYLRDLREGRLD